MKKIFKATKELIVLLFSNIILLVGAGLFVYNLFNFSSGHYNGKGVLVGLDEAYPVATYYYYSDETLVLLAISAILIIIGILQMKQRFNKRS